MPQLQQYNTEQNSQPKAVDSSLLFLVNQSEAETWFSQGEYQFPTLIKEPTLPSLPFQEKQENNSFPLFYIYLGIVIVWALFNRNNFKTLDNIAKSFISNTALGQMLDERRSFNGFVSIGVFLLGLIVLSIFSFQFIKIILPLTNTTNFIPTQPYIFVLLAALISATFVKSLIIWLSTILFKEQGSLTGYMSLNVISIQILGVILFPLIVLFSYTHHFNSLWIVGIGASIIGVVFLYRLIRTIFLAVKETNSQVFHIILYICALEILPLFVLGKLVLG